LGEKESLRHYRGEPTSWQFKLAKKIVFDKVKAAIGLDQAVLLAYGSAPIDPAVRKYFMSMNFVLMNGYGMT
jgi:long-chain-fatty-acid--CoA ligase ACSBG